VLASNWYAEWLKARQKADLKLWDRHVRNLKAVTAKANYAEEAERLGVSDRLIQAEKTLENVRSAEYPKQLADLLNSRGTFTFHLRHFPSII
jgi:hypothetical protein